VVGEYVPRRLERIVRELTDIGCDNLGQLCDVRRRADIENLVAATADRFGRVDAIVNNAVTYGGPGPLADITEAQMDDVYTSGVKAALWGMQAVYPHMRAAGWGRRVRGSKGGDPRLDQDRGQGMGCRRNRGELLLSRFVRNAPEPHNRSVPRRR
jgi:NAD(P)-dependent dehydrogenase (short-subunit alcohol dehydrogenase family)